MYNVSNNNGPESRWTNYPVTYLVVRCKPYSSKWFHQPSDNQFSCYHYGETCNSHFVALCCVLCANSILGSYFVEDAFVSVIRYGNKKIIITLFLQTNKNSLVHETCFFLHIGSTRRGHLLTRRKVCLVYPLRISETA